MNSAWKVQTPKGSGRTLQMCGVFCWRLPMTPPGRGHMPMLTSKSRNVSLCPPAFRGIPWNSRLIPDGCSHHLQLYIPEHAPENSSLTASAYKGTPERIHIPAFVSPLSSQLGTAQHTFLRCLCGVQFLVLDWRRRFSWRSQKWAGVNST